MPHFKNTRNYRKGLIPNRCEIPGCEFTAMVTRHRIKPGRKGGRYILGNVIGLCPNHHALAELGHYTQYELFQIVLYRIKLEQMEKQKVRESTDGYTEVVRGSTSGELQTFRTAYTEG